MTAIAVNGLFVSRKGTQVLQDVSFEVQTGSVYALLGGNGAGKSTTVRIMTGLDNDFQGEVIVNGINVKEDPLAVKKVIGYIPEVAELYDVLTPMEYLDLIGKLHGLDDTTIQTRATNMLGQFGLSEHLNQRMDTFSKGMRQKVLIVSGLIHNPQIIFFD